MKESNLIAGVVATVAVLAFAAPVTSFAVDLEGRAEKVNYADLDLDKERGVRALYRRLQLASERVCGVESLREAGTLRVASEQRRCYAESLDAAVARVGNARLTAIHEG